MGGVFEGITSSLMLSNTETVDADLSSDITFLLQKNTAIYL